MTIAQIDSLEFFRCPTHHYRPAFRKKSACYGRVFKLCVMACDKPGGLFRRNLSRNQLGTEPAHVDILLLIRLHERGLVLQTCLHGVVIGHRGDIYLPVHNREKYQRKSLDHLVCLSVRELKYKCLLIIEYNNLVLI